MTGRVSLVSSYFVDFSAQSSDNFTFVIDGEPWVHWNSKCRFALVIFSVVRLPKSKSLSLSHGNCDGTNVDTDEEIDEMAWENDTDESLRPDQVPWTFQHEERPGKYKMDLLITMVELLFALTLIQRRSCHTS